MRKFLLLISVLLLSSVCYSQALRVNSQYSQKYQMNIMFPNANITGLCILRDNGTQVVGSVINEFGIKSFDFTYDKDNNKTKLNNVIKLLDKWYIKKVLSADLSCLLRTENTQRQMKKRALILSGDDVTLKNKKHHIIYNFNRINGIIE